MQWKNRRASTNVEDRRGMGRTGIVIGGGGSFILLVLYLLFGGNLADIPMLTTETSRQSAVDKVDDATDELRDFVAVVLADTEDVWHAEFEKLGLRYQEPKLIIYSDRVDSACGIASRSVGPFYCPADQQLYIDLSFLRDMGRSLGAKGDFAQAYVVAHEVGHHVQNLLGVMDQVNRRGMTQGASGAAVRLELQADFLAGVWARQTQDLKQVLEAGDLEEAIHAAAAVGDDRLQMQSHGMVVPDSFTHGTAEQRARWFRKGFETGDIRAGNTFDVAASRL